MFELSYSMVIRIFTLFIPFYVVNEFGHQVLSATFPALPLTVTTLRFFATMVLRALVER